MTLVMFTHCQLLPKLYLQEAFIPVHRIAESAGTLQGSLQASTGAITYSFCSLFMQALLAMT